MDDLSGRGLGFGLGLGRVEPGFFLHHLFGRRECARARRTRRVSGAGVCFWLLLLLLLLMMTLIFDEKLVQSVSQSVSQLVTGADAWTS